MALCATSSYYDINEVATRILPNVVVLIIDPDRLDIHYLIYNYIIIVFLFIVLTHNSAKMLLISLIIFYLCLFSWYAYSIFFFNLIRVFMIVFF